MAKNKVKRKERSDFVESLIETFKSNGTLFTGLAVALIILTGMTLVNNPGQWWIIAVGVLVFGAIVFLFMNARVVIKVAIVFVLAILISSESFKFGSMFDQHGAGGLLWMCAILFTFFSLMSYSYLTNSGASRWGALGTSTVFGYITTFALSIASFNIMLSIIVGMLIAIAVFLFLYKGTRKTRYSKSGMPANVFDNKIEKMFTQAAESSGWNITSMKDKKNENNGGFLLWDERAYFVYPVDMDVPFSNIGRKTLKLGYLKKSINPWLLNLAFKETPLWRSRGANINVVLLDINNKNGEPKIIGASLPDSKKKLPIGIFPAKPLKGDNVRQVVKIIDKIDLEMVAFTKDLTEKQRIAISRINKEETEEIEVIIEEDSQTVEEETSNENITEENNKND